ARIHATRCHTTKRMGYPHYCGSCDAQGPEAQTLWRMEGIVKFLVDVFDGTGEAVAIRYVPVPCHSA
ncbi:MAG: hypothetical protein KA175_17725, partial [Flavobacteriales bacterium]|nr:hypothetical protein [Flavobacteriales bacterium]